MITFKCSCGVVLNVADALAYKVVTCNNCARANIQLPGSGETLDLKEIDEAMDLETIDTKPPKGNRKASREGRSSRGRTRRGREEPEDVEEISADDFAEEPPRKKERPRREAVRPGRSSRRAEKPVEEDNVEEPEERPNRRDSRKASKVSREEKRSARKARRAPEPVEEEIEEEIVEEQPPASRRERRSTRMTKKDNAPRAERRNSRKQREKEEPVEEVEETEAPAPERAREPSRGSRTRSAKAKNENVAQPMNDMVADDDDSVETVDETSAPKIRKERRSRNDKSDGNEKRGRSKRGGKNKDTGRNSRRGRRGVGEGSDEMMNEDIRSGNRQLLIIVAVVILVVAGIASFFLLRGKNNTNVVSTEPAAPSIAENKEEEKPKVPVVEAFQYDEIKTVGDKLIAIYEVQNKNLLQAAIKELQGFAIDKKISTDTYNEIIGIKLKKKLNYILALNDILTNEALDLNELKPVIYTLISLMIEGTIAPDKLIGSFPLKEEIEEKPTWDAAALKTYFGNYQKEIVDVMGMQLIDENLSTEKLVEFIKFGGVAADQNDALDRFAP